MAFITHITTMNRTWTEEKRAHSELRKRNPKNKTKQNKQTKKKTQINLLVLEDFISSEGIEILY